MKITCGTDIIEIDRIQKAIQNAGDKFLQTVFTQKEIEYCETKKNQKYQHYAARFAAKEAAFKALSKLVQHKMDWKMFEVAKLQNGKPEIKVNREIANLESIDISISHCKQYATANVIAIFSQ